MQCLNWFYEIKMIIYYMLNMYDNKLINNDFYKVR